MQMVVALKSRGYLNSIKPRVRHVSNATASVPIEFVYIYFGIQLWNVHKRHRIIFPVTRTA